MPARKRSSYAPGLKARATIPTSVGPGDSIEDGSSWLYANLEDGVICPLCDQNAQLFRRPLYDKMAAWLVWLVREYEREPRWISVNEGPVFQNRKGGGDYSKLRHWDLIVRQPNEDPDKLRSGIWKPTKDGIDFAHGRVRVPKVCWIYNDRVHAWSAETTDIREALGRNFSVQDIWTGAGAELMANRDGAKKKRRKKTKRKRTQ